MARKEPKQPRKQSAKWEAKAKADQAVAWAAVFEKLVDKCGLAGAFLIFVCVFVVIYASADQKKDIIDLFILGRSIRALYPALLSSAAFILLLFGQQFYYDRRIRTFQMELTRFGQCKRDPQDKQFGEPLHHTLDK